MPKRKINANQIAADIRTGMSDSQLMQKYALSEHQLWAVKTKLARLNLVPAGKAHPQRQVDPIEPEPAAPISPVAGSVPSQPDGQREATPGMSRPRDNPTGAAQREWVCPSCGNRQPREYDECPVCGIVVSKYRADYQQGAGVVSRSYAPENDEAPDSSTGWKAVAISIAIMAILGVGLIKWASHRSGPRGVSGSGSYETGFVKAFTASSFKNDVVEASRTYPVLVEFYAYS